MQFIDLYGKLKIEYPISPKRSQKKLFHLSNEPYSNIKKMLNLTKHAEGKSNFNPIYPNCLI